MAFDDQAFYLNEALEKRLGFSRSVRSGNHLYVSGCVSSGPDGQVIGVGDMPLQVATTYERIREVLNQHGLTFQNVFKEVMFVTDLKAFVAAGATRNAVYEGVAPPAATGVEISGLMHPDMMVEIEVIAEFRD